MIQSAQEKRVRARRLAELARRKSSDNRPQLRSEVRTWLGPIRAVLNELRTGEIDTVRGYAITRIHFADEDYARVDHCINGFVAMLERLDGSTDVSPLRKVSTKLENGLLLTVPEIDACFALLNTCEDHLRRYTRAELADAAKVEQINIELERMGLKEAA